MTDVDEVITDIVLSHRETDRVYDPAKRKEYYERTKKLKGRSGSRDNSGLPDKSGGGTNTRVAPDLDPQLKKAQAKAAKAKQRLARAKSLDSKLKRAERAAKRIPHAETRKKALAKIRAKRKDLDTAVAKKQAADNKVNELTSAKQVDDIRNKRVAAERAARQKENKRKANSIGSRLGRQAARVRSAIDKVDKADQARTKRLEDLEKKVARKAKDAATLKTARSKARKQGAKDKKKVTGFFDQVKKDFKSASGS